MLKGLHFNLGEAIGFMSQNAQLRKVQLTLRPTRAGVADITPQLERRWFEFDRSAVLRQLDLVQHTIDENADDLGMVAVEGVFEKPLSDGILRASRALHLMAQELTALRGQVSRVSGYPKADKKLQ
jgi:hypothetical protein